MGTHANTGAKNVNNTGGTIVNAAGAPVAPLFFLFMSSQNKHYVIHFEIF